MNSLRALIRISFLEFIRDRMVWICLFVAVVLFGFSLILGSLSFQEQQRILAHFGWMAIQVSGLGIGLFLGANWLHKEMDRQTCLLVLARPISRSQLYLGKYLGIFLLLFLIQTILAVSLFALLKFNLSLSHFIQVYFGTLMEISLIFSLTFFAATFTSPALAFFFGVGIFLMGHWMQEIEFFGQKVRSEFYVSLAQTVKWICPNLFQMNWRSIYFLENGISNEQIVWVFFHALGWVLLSISAGMLVFRRKDLV
jgi:ABC-type transport system involved in multi-copper enzyme maturation permease subunit